jgi:hypothetical protein
MECMGKSCVCLPCQYLTEGDTITLIYSAVYHMYCALMGGTLLTLIRAGGGIYDF